MSFLGRLLGSSSAFGFRDSEKSVRSTSTSISKDFNSNLKLASIPSGQFFLNKPPVLTPQIIFENARVAVQNVPSMNHAFHLAVSHVKNVNGERVEDEVRKFLISEALEFRVEEDVMDGYSTLLWKDLVTGGQTYQFVTPGVQSQRISLFVQCVHRAIYERKFRRCSLEASLGDLQSFVIKPKTSAKTLNRYRDGDSISALVASRKASKSVSGDSKAKPTIITKPASLYLWEEKVDRSEFSKVEDVDASIDTCSLDHFLSASNYKGQRLLSQMINFELIGRWSPKLLTFTWNDSQGSSWSLKFEDFKDFEEFRDVYLNCLHKVPSAAMTKLGYKVKDEARDNIMIDVLSMESLSESGTVSEESLTEGDSEGSLKLMADSSSGKRTSNSQLAVGHMVKNTRTFVLRENYISVFGHPEEGGLERISAIKVSGLEMKCFKPTYMMLHDKDTKIILFNPLYKSSLFALDIEAGKIVEEWKIDKDIAIRSIAPNSKYAQSSSEQTIVAISSNAIFRIDPRLGGKGGNSMAEKRSYVSRYKFSGMTTAADGKLVVASENGSIRLYGSVGKIAKSAFPAMGDPVVGVDVTGDGRWIVATCKTYLLVIDTLIHEGNYRGSLGFTRSFPIETKPQIKRLQLRQEHAAYMNQEISFTAARFNRNEGQEENVIITSTGQFVVVFDFALIKKGQLESYSIKRYDEKVIQSDFKYGDANEIIVALAHKVSTFNKGGVQAAFHGVRYLNT